jgi:hypothetical protein
LCGCIDPESAYDDFLRFYSGAGAGPQVANSDSLTLSRTSFTFAVWIKLEGSGKRVIFYQGSDIANLQIYADAQHHICTSQAGSTLCGTRVLDLMPNGGWHSVVVTWLNATISTQRVRYFVFACFFSLVLL